MSSEPQADRLQTPDVTIDRLRGAVPRRRFICGAHEIDRWVPNAHKDHDQLKARVWGAHLTGNAVPVGIYGLRIRLEPDTDIEGSNGVFRAESRHFAAVQLCYLGVQTQIQNQGVGGLLMSHAIREFAHVAEKTGICAMTLVAINGEKASWYERLGFKRYGRECSQPKLFLPARTALDMVGLT